MNNAARRGARDGKEERRGEEGRGEAEMRGERRPEIHKGAAGQEKWEFAKMRSAEERGDTREKQSRSNLLSQ